MFIQHTNTSRNGRSTYVSLRWRAVSGRQVGLTWRRLYAGVRWQVSRKRRALRLHGLYTNGGVDENYMRNWMGNVFNLDKHHGRAGQIFHRHVTRCHLT